MANRYNFASIAGSVSDEMQRLLVERRAQEQQEFLNALASRKQDLDEQQERRMAEFQQEQFKDLALNRESQRADRIYDDLMPGEIDADTAALLTKHGRGGGIQRGGQLGQAGEAQLDLDPSIPFDITKDFGPEDMAELDKTLTGSVRDLKTEEVKPTVAPGVIFHRGGAKALLQKQAEQARADQARENRVSQQFMARENRLSRENVAEDNRLARENTARLAREASAAARQQQQTNATNARNDGRILSLDARFGREQIVKNYNEVALKAETVSQIVDGAWSGPGDLAVVFEFMRALDPTSVVRESEYATAAKSGQWFRGQWAKLNGQFNPEGGFLSPQVRAEFKRLVGLKLNAQRKQYDNLAREYGEKIDKITGQGGTGQDHLTNYAGAFDSTSASSVLPSDVKVTRTK